MIQRADKEREREVIGAVLLIDGFMTDAIQAGVSETTWTTTALRDLWIAARAAHDAGQAIRRPTIEDDLRRVRKLEASAKAVEYFFGGRFRANREAAFADIAVLLKLARVRALEDGLRSAQGRLQDGGSLDDALAAAEQDLLELTAIGVNADRPLTMNDLVCGFYTNYIDPDRRFSQGNKLPTYIGALDRMLGGGLPTGVPVVVAARPSKGKSAFLKTLVLKLWRARRTALPGLVFSPEMSAADQFERAVSECVQKPIGSLMYGDMTEMDLERVQKELLWLKDMRWTFDDRSKLSVGDIAARLREWVRSLWPGHSANNPPPPNHPSGAIGFVGIDYLQKLKPPADMKRAPRAEQVAGISEALRLEAKKYPWLCFLVLAQLRRPKEDDQAMKLPSMDELRESGDIENDAGVIILLHRWGEVRAKRIAAIDPRHPQARWSGATLALLEKNRGGETGVCRLFFHAGLTGFYDWDVQDLGEWTPSDFDTLPADIAERINPSKKPRAAPAARA